MGNSQVLTYWDHAFSSLHHPAVLDPEECEQFTSLSSFHTYTLTSALDLLQDFYEAQDETERLFHLHLYRIEDFKVVKELRRQLEFLQVHSSELHSPTITDIIEQPRSDGSWSIAVLSPSIPFLSLEQWLDSIPDSSVFALDDVIAALLNVLEALKFAHGHEQWAGLIVPRNLLLVNENRRVRLVLNLLHSECFEDLRASRESLVNPPEGLSHSKLRDVWDLGVTLLTVTFIQVLEGTKPAYEVSVPAVQSSKHPEALRHLLSLMLRAEDQRPSPESLLFDPVLRFFQTGLSDPQFVPNTQHLSALCLGVSLRCEELKERCLLLLLGLISRAEAVELGDNSLEVDLREVALAAKRLDLSSESHLIRPLMHLCRKQLQRQLPLLALKRSGIAGLLRQCLKAILSQPHPRDFLPPIMQVAKESGLTTCICAVYDAKLIKYGSSEIESETESQKEFVLATCHRCGNRAISAIISAYREARWVDRTQALALLRKVPLHSFKHRSRADLPKLENLLKELLQEPQHPDQKVADVTSFVVHSLQGLQLRSFCALRGLCFSSRPVGVTDEVLECEMGYCCRDCETLICQTCLRLHRTHEVDYVGKVVCGQQTVQPMVPLFEVLSTAHTGESQPSEPITGPGQRIFQLPNRALNSENEQLTVYMEFYIAVGGDFDDFKLSAGDVHFSGQIGRIESPETAWPAPLISQGDVIGFGITSRSRVIFTFNGVLHPAVVAVPVSPQSVAISLDEGCKVKVKTADFLFDSALSARQPGELKSHFQTSVYSKSFWTQFENSISHSSRCHEEANAVIKRSKHEKPDTLEQKSRANCKHCLLF